MISAARCRVAVGRSVRRERREQRRARLPQMTGSLFRRVGAAIAHKKRMTERFEPQG